MYLNNHSYKNIQELNESLSTIVGGAIIVTLITALIKAAVDFFFTKDQINFKNKRKAIEAVFDRKNLPSEFIQIIDKYTPNSEYARKGLFGVWKDMHFRYIFSEPSIFITIKLREDFDLNHRDIIVGKAKGNSRSYFVLSADNKIYLVTKVSRVKKYNSYKELLDKYYNITLKS